MYEYNSGTTEAQLVEWLMKKVGESITHLHNNDEFDNFLLKNKVAAVLFSYDDYIIRSVAMNSEGVAFGFVRSD